MHTLNLATRKCRMLATHADLNEQEQLADGKVDRRGRFIVGSSDRGMKGSSQILNHKSGSLFDTIKWLSMGMPPS